MAEMTAHLNPVSTKEIDDFEETTKIIGLMCKIAQDSYAATEACIWLESSRCHVEANALVWVTQMCRETHLPAERLYASSSMHSLVQQYSLQVSLLRHGSHCLHVKNDGDDTVQFLSLDSNWRETQKSPLCNVFRLSLFCSSFSCILRNPEHKSVI